MSPNDPSSRASDAPDASSEALSRLPRSFGRYTLFDVIGRGGMAEIFLARSENDLGATRLCAVKQILPAYSADPQFADMLIFEAKLAARLNHTNIVQVLDLGRSNDQLFIAMDYVEGFDLNALLRQCTQTKTALPLEYALYIVTSVLTALDYAHRRLDESGASLGVVHRDISPSNVLVSFGGEVKLCDFGIAHANDIVAKSAPDEAAIKGKAGYMSPEHARGEAVDARSDLFAVGILMWELLSGRRMYKADGSETLLAVARRADVPTLESSAADEALTAIVMSVLTVDREKRAQSAGELLSGLERWMQARHLSVNALKFGEWLSDRFGNEIVEHRRARERRLPKSTPPPPPPIPASPSGPPPAAMGLGIRLSEIGGVLAPPKVPPMRPVLVSSGAMENFLDELQKSKRADLDTDPPPPEDEWDTAASMKFPEPPRVPDAKIPSPRISERAEHPGRNESLRASANAPSYQKALFIFALALVVLALVVVFRR